MQTAVPAACYLCESLITGPAVPRPHEDTGEKVLLCPECWEMCAGCCSPLQVFEPVRAFSGDAPPLIVGDRGARLLAVVDGVRLHLCDRCQDV